jgi:protocatechuate 3,4-dioxygenase beta subunit
MTTSRSRGETVAVRAFAAVLLALPLPAFAQARTGTGRIAGHVVAAGQQPTPARRAIVSLGGGNTAGRRSVVTGDDGAFVFEGLPPGRFTITASKPAFLAASYGATRPGRPGTAISLAAGQAVDDVVIRLVRGAVITGTVRDRNGEPVPRARMAVVAIDAPDRDPMTPPAITSDVLTDDRGVYRAYGLEPGAYLVAAATPGGGIAAQPMDVLSSAEMDAAFEAAARSAGLAGPLGAATAAPSTNRQRSTVARRHYTYSGIFYPGTADPAQATPITVAAGQERGGVDITFTPVPTATIEGVVTSAFGPLPALRVYLGSPTRVAVPGFVRAAPLMTKSPGADGRFTFSGVVPGQYTLTAQALVGGPTMIRTANGFTTSSHVPTPEELAAPLLWARVPLTVNGEDISGAALALQPAPRISGRITFDAVAATPPEKLDGRVELTPLSQEDLAVARPSGGGVGVVGPRIPTVSAPVDDDGTFTFRGVMPGTYVADASVPAARGWWLRSAMLDGRDLLDAPLAIAGGESDMTGLVLTFTDRHTEVTGRLQTPAGTPAPDYYVVVFTTDRTMWRSDGRRLAFARPGSDGTFVIRDLPAGDYCLAALTDLDPRNWKRADLLDQVVPASLRIAIAEGGHVVQNLQIAK